MASFKFDCFDLGHGCSTACGHIFEAKTFGAALRKAREHYNIKVSLHCVGHSGNTKSYSAGRYGLECSLTQI